MRTIRLDIDGYSKRQLAEQDGAGPMTPQQVSLSVLIAAVNLAYSAERGRQMTLQEARIWAKIQDRVMDEDGKAIAGPIDVSDEQFDFIFSKLTEAHYPPVYASAVTALVDSLERIKLEAAK